MSNTWGGARPGAGRKSRAHIKHCHELLQQASTDEDYVRGFRELFSIWKNDDVTRPYAKPRESIEAAKVILRYTFGIPEPEEPEQPEEIQPIRNIENCSPDVRADDPAPEPAPVLSSPVAAAQADTSAASATPLRLEPQLGVPRALSEPVPPCPAEEETPPSPFKFPRVPAETYGSIEIRGPVPIEQQIPSYVIAQYDSLEALRAAFPNAPEIRNLPPEVFAEERAQSGVSAGSTTSLAPHPYSRLRDRRRRHSLSSEPRIEARCPGSAPWLGP